MPALSAASSPAAATAADLKRMSAAASRALPSASGVQLPLGDLSQSSESYAQQGSRHHEPQIVSLDSEADGEGEDDDETRDTSLSDGTTSGKLPSLPSIQSLLGLTSGAFAVPFTCLAAVLSVAVCAGMPAAAIPVTASCSSVAVKVYLSSPHVLDAD